MESRRNLLYFCVFYNTDYILLLQEVFRSIDRCGGLDANTDILILTHPTYKSEIENAAKELNLVVQFFFIEFNSLFHSAYARLFLYEWKSIQLYGTILYLDTDILINGVLARIFALPIEPDCLYALEEGTIGSSFWGGDLFDFSTWDPAAPGFTSGVLLFKNSPGIQILFHDTIQHIHHDLYIEGKRIPDCLEQPYIIYNAYKQNKYNIKVLKDYVENNPVCPGNKIIYHFPGGPGGFVSKYTKMLNFLKMLL
jgi:hypothetical protein